MRNRWSISTVVVVNLSGADGQFYAEYSIHRDSQQRINRQDQKYQSRCFFRSFPKDADSIAYAVQDDFSARYESLITNYLRYGEPVLAGRTHETRERIRAYVQELQNPQAAAVSEVGNPAEDSNLPAEMNTANFVIAQQNNTVTDSTVFTVQNAGTPSTVDESYLTAEKKIVLLLEEIDKLKEKVKKNDELREQVDALKEEIRQLKLGKEARIDKIWVWNGNKRL